MLSCCLSVLAKLSTLEYLMKRQVDWLRQSFSWWHVEARPYCPGLKLQCIWKVFTALHFFHISLCYSLIPKWIQFIFFLTILHTIPNNANTQKGFFLNVWKCIRNKEQKYNMYISIHSLCSVLCCGTLAAITASSLLEYEATSLAHLSLASFAQSSLQNPLSSIRLLIQVWLLTRPL